MTSFELPIRRISIEAFRGFRDRQEFDLNASAIIISGPNGTGKTSFFDALQWCFLGSIRRLEGLRARKSVEHIVNQYRLSDRASVELEMVIGGQPITLRRTGDRSGSTLELRRDNDEPVFGEEAERALARLLVPSEGLTLDVALTTSGLMQQDVMRAVLEAKPAERYKHISTVLGLGSLEDFEDAIQAAANKAKTAEDAAQDARDAAQMSVERVRNQFESARNRIASLPRLEQLREELRSRLHAAPNGLAVEDGTAPRSPEGFRTLASHTASLTESLTSFSNLWEQRQTAQASLAEEPTEDERIQLEAELDVARQNLELAEEEVLRAESQLRTAEAAAEEMVRLAALAVPLLSDSCPVCGQSIEPQQVERELRARSSQTGTTVTLRERVEAAQSRRADLHVTIERLQSQLQSRDEAARQWSRARTAAERSREAWESLPKGGPLSVQSSDEQDLIEKLPALLTFLQGLREFLLGCLDSLDRATDQGEVARTESEIASYTKAFENRAAKLEETTQRAQRLKALAKAAVEARVEVTEERFRAIQPLVADIFGRLDPHPAFKTIEFELDTYYRRGATTPMVRDLVAQVTADPLMVFSTSQANIAALSYFLAMGWSAGERRLPFVLLDDPIQSMDDVNVLGFSDLCRHLRNERQLFISTHERRFASLLERKLAPRSDLDSTLVLKFAAWDRSGPAVESRVVSPQLLEAPIRVVQTAM